MDGKWIGQVTELIPFIKIHVPAFSHPEFHPVTISKVCNGKLYHKSSSALIEVASKCMELFEERTFLLWQPPTYPLIPVIS